MSIPGSVNPLFLGAAAQAEGGYNIERSVRFNSSDSAFLSRTPASAGNRKTWTWAGWGKRSAFGAINNVFNTGAGVSLPVDGFVFQADNTLKYRSYDGSSEVINLVTTQVFRDPSAWFHIVFAIDTTQATSTNRVKIYINGSQVTAFSTATYGSQNYDTGVNATMEHRIGDYAGDNYFNGYLADIHLIDGQALDPTSFGEFDDNGIWQPKAYTGTYGTNGGQLKFEDNSTAAALGTDTSGNENDWTANNLSVTAGADNDSLVDVPTNGAQTDTGAGGEVRGNYCTGNWLNQSNFDILKDGNLHWRVDNTRVVTGTIAMSQDKWYWEATVDGIVNFIDIGIVGTSIVFSGENNTSPGAYSSGYIYRSNANKVNNNSSSSYGASFASGDTIGIAFDHGAGTLTFYKNGVSQGTAFTGIPAGSYVPTAFGGSGGGNTGAFFNFGQRSFVYTAPSGFKALCTANLP
jgi:hypothetical protein